MTAGLVGFDLVQDLMDAAVVYGDDYDLSPLPYFPHPLNFQLLGAY